MDLWENYHQKIYLGDFYGMFVGFFDIFWGFDGNFMFLFGGMIINW